MPPGEFHELRTYLVLKLLWDPETDIDRHISEFCGAYYGAAAPDVIEFIRTFETQVKGYNALSVSMCHMACSDGGENIEAHTSLTERDVKTLNAIMERAKGRGLTEAEAYRLHGLELSWRLFKNATFAGEFNWFSYKYDPEEEAEKLFNDLKAYGVAFLAEAGHRVRRSDAEFQSAAHLLVPFRCGAAAVRAVPVEGAAGNQPPAAYAVLFAAADTGK